MNRVKLHRSSCAPFDALHLALIAILLAAAFAAPLSTAAVTPSTQPAPGVTVTAVTVPPASSGQPNFRRKRLRLHSQHAAEHNPGDR